MLYGLLSKLLVMAKYVVDFVVTVTVETDSTNQKEIEKIAYEKVMSDIDRYFDSEAIEITEMTEE